MSRAHKLKLELRTLLLQVTFDVDGVVFGEGAGVGGDEVSFFVKF